MQDELYGVICPLFLYSYLGTQMFPDLQNFTWLSVDMEVEIFILKWTHPLMWKWYLIKSFFEWPNFFFFLIN